MKQMKLEKLNYEEFDNILDYSKDQKLEINDEKYEKLNFSEIQKHPQLLYESEYEKKIREYTNNKGLLILKENTKVNIRGIGILYIIVEENIDLNLYFNSEEISCLYIKILVKKGRKLRINEVSNSKKLWNFIETYLEKESNLSWGAFSFDFKIKSRIVYLNEDSNYNMKEGFYLDSNKSYLKNTAIHNEKNSKSNFSVKGACINGAEIQNDGLIRIENNAPGSEGYQKLMGILLDKISIIKSEPLLEIENADVKCSHGASIAQIKDEITFYMNSRGLNNQEARTLYLSGFFEEAKILNESDIQLEKYFFNR
jgi:Fe-S cluster assembly scaffold protein SufB